MNNKFENEIEEEKLLKKRLLDRISVSLYITKALYLFSYKFFKAKLKKYFWPSFPENKIHSSTRHKHIRFKF